MRRPGSLGLWRAQQSSIASAELAADATPIGSMRVDRHEAGNSTTLWLDGNGVETALHYDMSHNFFVQLHGCCLGVVLIILDFLHEFSQFE